MLMLTAASDHQWANLFKILNSYIFSNGILPTYLPTVGMGSFVVDPAGLPAFDFVTHEIARKGRPASRKHQGTSVR